MSAAANIANVGTGVRNVAIGVGILGGVYLLYVVLKKASDAASGAKKTVTDATGFLFGGDSAPSTVGTWLYDKLNPPADYYDATQAEKTRAALRGNPTSNLINAAQSNTGLEYGGY